MIRPIIRYGEQTLHRPAAPVGEITVEIQQLIDDMIQTMYAAPGIGLAATQVGVGHRIFVADISVGRNPTDLIAFVNPEFVEREGMQLEEEGCLSVPGFNATVARPTRAVVKGLDRHGDPQTIEGVDLLARCFQHEMDHLEGVVFVDRLRGLQKDLIVRKIKEAVALGQMVEAALRLVFFGTPEFAVPTLRELLHSRHTIVGVVTQPDRARGRGQKISFSPVKALALEHQLPVIQPDKLRDPAVVQALAAWQPDLGIVAAYGRIIPEHLLTAPRLGMINVHGSLLPYLRGAAPVHRAVIAGEADTGITIMRVVKELDAGNMFAKVIRPIAPDETSDVVERDLAEIGARLLVDVVDQIAAGTAVEEPQDSSIASYAAKITKDEGTVDWALDATAIHNRVRGLYPWPHAHTFLNGRRLILLQTRVVPEPTLASPGTVVAVTGDGIHVATGHGGRVAIERLQTEGRRPMSAREFLAGHPIQDGARLGT